MFIKFILIRFLTVTVPKTFVPKKKKFIKYQQHSYIIAEFAFKIYHNICVYCYFENYATVIQWA